MKNSTATILIVIAGGLFYTFISPQYDQVSALRDQASSYQNVLDNVTALSEKRDELLVKYQGIPKTEVSDLAKVLPDHTDVVRLAMDLDSIAGKYGIAIKQISTSDDNKTDNTSTIVQAAPASGYNTTTVSFSFITTYDNFRKYIHDVEQSLRISDVQSVSFGTSDTGLIEYRVAIKTYWLK
jgi:Tfp pilus assembly protein PilO